MNEAITITGRIVSGAKKAAFFTQLDWVQEQCQKKLGFKPYPGTLNLEIDEETIPIVEALQQMEGAALVPPDEGYCSGYVFPVSVMGVSGAVVTPAEEVRVHGKNIIEILAPISLKEALDVKDGDEIMLTLKKGKRIADSS
jgi:CTP-dependent riboflavin kinase